MIRHEPVLPPEHIYPIDEWRWVEKRFNPDVLAQSESLFSTANGYLGMRGGFEEGTPSYEHGTFINGFYESWPIVYGEEAFGFARTGQTIVNVPDGKIIRLYVDDDSFYLRSANLLSFERALDFRSGTLDRYVVWELRSGKKVRITSRRLVSFPERRLAAIRYEVTLLNAKAPVVIASELVNHQREMRDDPDPRRARALAHQVLVPQGNNAGSFRAVLSYMTQNSRMRLACGVDHILETDCEFTSTSSVTDDLAQFVFSLDGEEGKTIRLTKFLTYHISRTAPPHEVRARAERTLDRANRYGYDYLLQEQRKCLDEFWQRSDVQIKMPHPRAQQCIRWNLFQLFQAAARAEHVGIPAKGLTAQAYDGHYFWDMEIYILPFFIYTAPLIAKNVLKYRFTILNKARQRAREVNQKGALFPWRTINGEEASAYYAAGTAQYHINADIMYALKKYVEVTGDQDFLFEYGAEMLVETARLWYDLGFFSDRQDGRFCIDGVTGPDEYTTVVNNNTYTNLMARQNLRYAAETVTLLREQQPEHFERLVGRTRLDLAEVEDWKQAADQMYLPFDERAGIHLQDDDFLDREVWDLKATPREKFPLLLHFHPLVIYRHQIIKQADITLAMFLLGQEFSQGQKKRNFDYYDPLTTGDSSLSSCIQSIVASEIGNEEKALAYFVYAALMDLADVGGNVSDGCHIASIGGTWMALINGFAGMRDYDGVLSFDPKPGRIQNLRFPLTMRDQRLEIDIRQDSVTYCLREGTGLRIKHRDEEIDLTPDQPVLRKL